MTFTPYLLLPLGAVVALMYVLARIWSLRQYRATQIFGVLLLAAIGTALLQALELSVQGSDWKAVFFLLRFVSFALHPPIFLLFVLAYTDQPPRRAAWLLLEPALMALVAATISFHHWFVYDFRISASGPFPVLLMERGPLYWAHLAYGGLVYGGAFVILFGAARKRRVFLADAFWILLGVLIPVLADVAHQLKISPIPGFGFTPTAMAVSGLIYGLALEKFRLFDLLPLAKSLVFEHLPDALLVFDGKNTLLEMNPAAESALGLEAALWVGQPLERLPTALREGLRSGWDSLSITGRSYEVRVSSLKGNPPQAAGKIILLRDVTEAQSLDAALQTQEIEMAVAEQREQIARRLHDTLAQTLGFIVTQAQAVEALLEQEQGGAARSNLAELQRVAGEAHTDLRKHILGLKMPAAGGDFLSSLREQARDFEAANPLRVALDAPDLSPGLLSPAVESQALLILQEAFANIRKHARASRVEVVLTRSADELLLMVADDGQGFQPERTPGAESGHFGLVMMQERAALCGGWLETRSAPGQGARLILHLPLDSQPNAPRRLLLVDDHPLFVEGLRNMLTARGFTVVGVAHNAEQALAQTRQLRPQLVVLDISMPETSGLELLPALQAEFPEINVVMLTTAAEDEQVLQAIQRGAAGFLLKGASANEFCAALEKIMRGELILPPEVAARLLRQQNPASVPLADSGLSPAQRRVAELVASGLTYKETATRLNLSERTIKHHMKQVLERLHLQKRADLARYLREK